MREEGGEGGRARCAAFSPFAAAGVVARRVERLLGQRPAAVVVVVVVVVVGVREEALHPQARG